MANEIRSSRKLEAQDGTLRWFFLFLEQQDSSNSKTHHLILLSLNDFAQITK
jgi:hypothetical protein